MKTMKTIKIFSTAALALMMAACSSEDTALNSTPAQEGQKVPFTATIAAPGSGAGTRTEYTEVTSGDAAGTINVAWKAGDEIALIHNGKADVVKVETVNTDGSATITGDITVGTDGEAIEVCYPAALWEWAEKSEWVEKSGAIRNETFVTNITTKQDGTLKYIQDNLDTRMGKGTLKVDGDKATLSDNVTLASQIAIWKLTLQDDAETPAALAATQVSVKLDGEVPVIIASTEKLSTATSSVYLAMDAITNETLTIEATVGEGTYSYTNEGVSLALGQYYQSTVTMAKAAAYLAWDNTKKELVATPMPDTYTPVTSSTTTWSAGTYVVEGDVNISGNIELNGDVNLIIKDGAKLTVNGYINGLGSPNKNLSIYGQANQTGQLVVNSSDDAISNINTLEVHSCQVTATSSCGGCGGFYEISAFNVYGGSVDATGSSGGGHGILLADNGSINIYGGDVKAVGKGTSYFGIYAEDTGTTVTVYGGKLWAECAGKKAIDFGNVTLTKDAGYTSGKIEYSSDKSDWSETKDTTAKYVRVGY